MVDRLLVSTMFHMSRLIPYHFIPVVHSFSMHHGEIINSSWNESRNSAIVIEYSDVVISGCQFMIEN